MNDQSTHDRPIAPTILPAKRRRGRPRKDGGIAKRGNFQSPVTPVQPESIKKVQNNAVEMSQKDSTMGGGNIVGQMVSGVVDGCFDAGYFISVRVGNSATTLRGLVFQPGRFAPITPANDVAPSATMYHRNQVASPFSNLQEQNKGLAQPIQQEKQLNVAPGQVLYSKPMSSAPFVPNNQFAPAPAMSQHSETVMAMTEARGNFMFQHHQDQRQFQCQSIPPVENLRMVEQDEVMQVFEVANHSEGAKINAEPAKRMFSESILEPKASEGTSNQAQNQLLGSMFHSDILFHSNHNSSSGEMHHNPAVAKSQQTLDNQLPESESKNDKQPNLEHSFMQTLLQPGESVHCETKKLEIHRAPIDAQTQLYPHGLPAMNTEIQLKDWSHHGQENQQNQFHHSSLFAELNSVAQETQVAETEVQPSDDQVHDELHNTFLEQHMPQALEGTNENRNPDINQGLITSETQGVPQESIRTSIDFMMENLSYPKNEESQKVELAGNAETSNETKETRDDPCDKLMLGSLLAPQQEEANIVNCDQSAKVESLEKTSDGGNRNLEMSQFGQETQP